MDSLRPPEAKDQDMPLVVFVLVIAISPLDIFLRCAGMFFLI